MDKRTIENQVTIEMIAHDPSISTATAQIMLLSDISRSLAVIADKIHEEEVEKSCVNCRFWTMDTNNPERKCSMCYELDKWEAED